MLILVFFSLSCSLFQDKKVGEDFRPIRDNGDYADHLASMWTGYVNSSHIGFIKLEKRGVRYLERLYNKIVANKSLTLENNIRPRFHIVDDKRTFMFSLPGGSFFFSAGLFAKYFRNEEALVSALVYEVIKSSRKIYKKRVVVPTGYLKTERMLELTRIPVEVKAKIYEWSYFVMKEINYDPAGILHWIQIQNRNYSDFTLQNGKAQDVSEEESRFKQFIVKKGINLGKIDKKNEKQLQEFYHLINYIKRRI